MKVEIERGKEECVVLAIVWQKSSQNEFTSVNSSTHFTVFDGSVLFDVRPEEVEITDETISDFVFDTEFDPDFFVLIWQPLLRQGFWSSIRDFDAQALSELKELLS